MLNDPVFGAMEYRYAWVKKETISLLDKEYNLTLTVSAYTGDGICDNQREAYKDFKGKLDKISSRMPGMVADYAETHWAEIKEHFSDLENPDEAVSFVTPVSVLFTRDGKIVIMCDAAWDEENGIGIEVRPEWKVDLQDVFL